MVRKDILDRYILVAANTLLDYALFRFFGHIRFIGNGKYSFVNILNFMKNY